ncbi:MAG: GPW/gp25 family protein [Wolinella sp.]
MYQISVKENIRRILTTNKYTKTLRPLFGLSRHIDKQATFYELLSLKEEIREQLERYEPRIKLISVSFSHEDKGIICEITYREEGTTQFFRLSA